MADEVELTVAEAGVMLGTIIKYNNNLADNPKAQRWEEPVVPYLQSPPGTGKTSLCWQIAKECDVQFRGVIGAQYDPAETAGFTFFDKDTRESWRAKPDFLPTEGRWLLLCDEFAQMTMMQKNIWAQLLQERRLGDHHLSPHATIVLAGNRAIDRAGVQPDPSHVTDRVFIINLIASLEEWTVWALRNGIRPEIVAYLKFRDKFFNQFDPTAKKNPTPRGWAKVSTFIQMGYSSKLELAAIQGQVGPGPAADFSGFLRVYRDLPPLDMLIRDPTNKKYHIDPKGKPDVVYAICGALASKADRQNVANIITYSESLPGEFAVMLMKDALTRDATLHNVKEVTKWLATRGAKLVMP